MSEEPPLVRQWVLLRLLSGRRFGATIKEMAQEMGVSDKTIRRDLETFEQAGFPLQEQIGEFGRKTWRLDGNSQPGLAFTFDEAIALYLGRRFLEPLAGTLFWEAAGRAFKKIRATLGPEALNYIERFGPMFHQTTVGASDYSKKADLIDQLLRRHRRPPRRLHHLPVAPGHRAGQLRHLPLRAAPTTAARCTWSAGRTRTTRSATGRSTGSTTPK